MKYIEQIKPKNPVDFEKIIKKYLHDILGFTNLKKTPIDGDFGADLFGTKDNQKFMKKDESDLKKFEILTNYLIYENTIFWSRSNYFLIAITGLLGLTITQIPSYILFEMQKVLTIFTLSFIGIILCYSWHCALKGGEFWINHWHELIIKYEKKCWEEELFAKYATRPGFHREPRFKAREIAYHVKNI